MIGQIASRLFMRGLRLCANNAFADNGRYGDGAGFFAGSDILYVGGGTTTAMLSHWRKSGIADLLLAATRRGLVASGVSAGAICWFSDLLLKTEDDCFEPQFEQHKGLGLIAGSACPHFQQRTCPKTGL
jgi:peptidase E